MSRPEIRSCSTLKFFFFFFKTVMFSPLLLIPYPLCPPTFCSFASTAFHPDPHPVDCCASTQQQQTNVGRTLGSTLNRQQCTRHGEKKKKKWWNPNDIPNSPSIHLLLFTQNVVKLSSFRSVRLQSAPTRNDPKHWQRHLKLSLRGQTNIQGQLRVLRSSFNQRVWNKHA